MAKSTMISIVLSVLLLSIAGTVTPAVAGENNDFRFARRLQRDGMYIAAAEEYTRFSEKYPASTLRLTALFNAGESWIKANRALNALEIFESLLADYPSADSACKARYYRGDILKVLQRYRQAADEFLMIDELYPDCSLNGQALLGAGECLVLAGDPHEAAAVLRRLVDSGRYPGLEPRAMYGLAVALTKISRDLEAVNVLEKLVSDFPESPVAALAIVKLGDRAFENGDYKKAEGYFRNAAGRYREDTLKEKVLLKVIDVVEAQGSDASVLKESEGFLKSFPESVNRPHVYRKAIDSAWKLGRGKEAVSLIDSWRSEETVQDSTGRFSLLRGSILEKRKMDEEALMELQGFRHTWTRSPLLSQALQLEARLLMKNGRTDEAAARLQLALIEGSGGEERASILSTLALLSIESQGDTLSALRYWELVVSENRESGVAEDALWKSAVIIEALGDSKRSSAKLRELLKTFPDGQYSKQAAEKLRMIELLYRPTGDVIKILARYAVRGDFPAPESEMAVKYMRVGVILLDKADRAEDAVAHFKKAFDLGLPDSLVSQARYYLGEALFRKYEISSAAGKEDRKFLKNALSSWLKVARESAGTYWGGESHRAYLENKLMEWKLDDQLKKLDEFLGYYRESDGVWWAVGKKADLLYEAASSGQEWAVDSSLAMCRELFSDKAPDRFRKEALLKTGYLMRIRGDLEAAAAAFGGFVSKYGGDDRTAPVLYDMGEVFIRLKDYKKALKAYTFCLEKRPARTLARKSFLRQGDCLYYLHDFKGAAGSYGRFAADNSGTPLADEASYREALALERLGRFERGDSILIALSRKKDIKRNLRIRLLSRLGYRLKATGKAMEAKPLLAELVSLERKHENLTLYGETLLETDDLKNSVRVFSDAVRFEGADSCRVLSGRASARFRMKDTKNAAKDLQLLMETGPGCPAIAGVLLEKGKCEALAGHCESASETFITLRKRYSGTPAAATALFHFAICDLKRGGYPEAIDKLNLFLREAPSTPILDQAYFKLASAHYGAGNLNLATVNYALAAEASSEDNFVFLTLKNLAMIYQELEEWEKAGDTWYRICERFPARDDIVEIFFNLGFCYGQTGKFEMAWEVYTRVPGIAKTEEQKGRAHYWAGISLKNQNRCEEAIREFLRVPYLRTGGMWGITSKLEAALCYEKLGQVDQAVQIYDRIVSAHGENSDWGSIAKKSLDRINGIEDADKTGRQQGRDSSTPGKKDG